MYTEGSTGRPTSPEQRNNHRARRGSPGGSHGAHARPARARACETPGGVSLDTTGNNSAALSRTLFLDAPIDRETGEVLARWDPTRKWILQQAHKTLNPSRRYLSCFATIRGDRSEVEVRISGDSGRCYLAGLMTCGSVWACPVCAAKIQAVRAEELKQAIRTAKALGLTVAMLTLTVPHRIHDDLGELLTGFTGSLGAVTGGRAWKGLRDTYGIAGYVRALEVTFGFKNGWHPHAHVLLFLNPDTNLDQLKKDIFPLWEKAVISRGLGAPSAAAMKLDGAEKAHAYVTKFGREWGVAEELVRSHTKSAREGGYSPFDLLGEYAYGNRKETSVKRFGALYREYCDVFHGRRQLQWSQGLKKRLLGSEGRTDAEIADSLGKLDEILSRISAQDWRLVLRARMTGAVVYAADLHGAEGVENLLKGLRLRFGVEEGKDPHEGEEEAVGELLQKVLHSVGGSSSRGRRSTREPSPDTGVLHVPSDVLRDAIEPVSGSRAGRRRGDRELPSGGNGPGQGRRRRPGGAWPLPD